MRNRWRHLLGAVVILALGLCLASCGGSKEADAPQAGSTTGTVEKKADPITEYGKDKLRKARTAQQLGDERTEAIDKSVQGK
jgi:hypothetical protein